MILSSITRTRKIKQFSFKARYYDEDKEDLEYRIAQVKAQVSGKPSFNRESNISLKDRWQRNRKVPSVLEKKSNIRLAGIVSALAGFFYWFLS